MAKKKNKPTDGLGAYEIAKIRSAVRLVWQRSHARKLAKKRCTNEEGFEVCEKCGAITPGVKIDHIEKVGDVDEGFLERMFVPSEKLQGLCHVCNKIKTKEERAKK